MEQKYLTVKQFAARAVGSTQRIYQLLARWVAIPETELLKETIEALTDALPAAQALHAGTIQERLMAQADSSEGQSEVMTAETVSDLYEGEPAREPQRSGRSRLWSCDGSYRG